MEKLGLVLKFIFKLAIVGFVFALIGFLSARLINYISPEKTAYNAQEYSIAIGETKSIYLINKKTQALTVISDTLALHMFKLYAGKIYQETNEK